MAEQYASFVVTNAGEDIITRILGGLSVTFKRIVIGDGFNYDTGTFTSMQGLVNEVKSLEIKSMTITDENNVELTADFGSADIESAFWYREIGIFVVDPDNDDNEILFAYGNRNDAAEYITPHVQNYAVLKTIKCVVRVGSSAKVNILITTNKATTTIDFVASDWVHDEIQNLYKYVPGSINNCLQVFKNTETGMVETGIVETSKDAEGNIVIKSLTAFDGCLVCI